MNKNELCEILRQNVQKTDHPDYQNVVFVVPPPPPKRDLKNLPYDLLS